MAGAAERIDQVAQTAIAEPPVIQVRDIASDEHPGTGYLCVAVPASPRAPHMLTIDGDNRYWARGATGNRVLTEGEVARLYERRERWETDRDALLADTVAAMPFQSGVASVGVIAVTVRPVMPGRELLRTAARNSDIGDFLQQQFIPAARREDPYPGQGTDGLGDAHFVSRAGAALWVCSRERDQASDYQARVEITPDGSITYWHSPLVRGNPREPGHSVLMEQSVTRAVYQTLAPARWLFETAAFHGPVDLGVAVLGIERASGASRTDMFQPQPTYGAPDYRRHERVTSEELQTGVEGIVRRLPAPLYEAISVRDYDPLPKRERG